MSDIQKHVAALAQEIGPRPAGTEEERQAALYISEALQRDAGLPAEIEDFNCNPDYELPRAICGVISVLVAVIAVVFPVAVIPAFVVTLVTGAIYVAEALGYQVISRLFNQGASQNVVARYEPPATDGGSAPRRRKIVLVARYDSGKVRKDLSKPLTSILPKIRWAELAGTILIPVLLLLRFVAGEGSALSAVLLVLLVVALVCAALPVVGAIVRRLAPYNEGANCNASGVAVLMEIATRIGRGSVAASEPHAEAVMHGEDAARESGFVPAGAELVYDMPAVAEPEFAEESPEARLMAAKAAVAALSGKPVSNTINIDISSQLVQVKEPPIAAQSADGMRQTREEAMNAFAPVAFAGEGGPQAGGNAPSGAVPAGQGSAANGVSAADAGGATSGAGIVPAAAQPAERDGSSVPAWFKSAQQKAKKTAAPAAASQRSRYADALDAAVRESSSHFRQANEAVASEAEQRLQQMRNSIMEVKAPGFEDVADFGIAASPGHAAGVEGELSAAEPHSAAGAGVPLQAGVAGTAASDGVAGSVSGEAYGRSQSRADELGASSAQAGAANEFEGAPHAAAGVGGFLSSVLSSADYESSSAAQGGVSTVPDSSSAAAAAMAAPVAGSSAALAGGSSLSVDAPALGMPGEAGVTGEIPSMQPVSVPPSPDRTISFIPVAVDQDVLSRPAQASSSPRDLVANPLDGQGSSSAAQLGEQTPRKKRTMSLPSLTGSLSPLEESHKQRAPLASRDAGALTSGLRSTVPAVGSGPRVAATPSDDQRALQSSLRAALPSLSGVIREQQGSSSEEALASDPQASDPQATVQLQGAAVNVSQAGSFASVGATGAFAPVGDELIEDVALEDVYVEDADDSAYEEQYTETGAFTGPGYVEMPKSRASRFFSKFRFGRKKEQEETTPQQWLDVDEEFEARAVGQARGGWESFREDGDQTALAGADGYVDGDGGNFADSYDSYDDGSDSYGGADGYDDGFYDDDYDSAFDDRPRGSRSWNGGAFSRESLGRVFDQARSKATGLRGGAPDASPDGLPLESDGDMLEGDFAAEGHVPGAAVESAGTDGAAFEMPELEDVRAEDVQRIYGFRHPDINTEVWFVALGSDLADNAGMRAFLSEHASELKGSIIVELDGLGAGSLSLIEREGMLKPLKSSPRMKRFVRKAASTLGVSVGSESMQWQTSAAACAMSHGYQAMHLAGMADGKPAFFGSADDVVDNVDENVMLANADFVMEVMKNI